MYKTRYTAEDNAGAGLSAMWHDCDLERLKCEPGYGHMFFDDFNSGILASGLTQTTAVAYPPNYTCFCTTAGKWTNAVIGGATYGAMGVKNGVIATLCDTDNDGASLYTTTMPFQLSSKKLWFEARIAVTSIATATNGILVGLCENITAGSATVPLPGADIAENTQASIGWLHKEDGEGNMCCVYNDRGTTFTEVGTNQGTITAATWHKYGLRYDPNNGAKALSWWVDGKEMTTGTTQATLTATTYLDAGRMGLMLATIADSGGTANYLYMDWWGCAQLK
jgi:hypothetical protein